MYVAIGKVLIGVFCIFVNVQEILVQKFGLLNLAYVDEVFALAAYFVAPFALRKKTELWLYGVLALPFLSILHGLAMNGFYFEVERSYETVVQSFVNFKFFLYFVLFYCISINLRSTSAAFRNIFMLCIYISLIGYAANIYAPEFFQFSDAIWHLERNRVAGFQFKANDLPIILSLGVIFGYLTFKGTLLRAFACTALGVLIILSSSRTALLCAIIGVLVSWIWRGEHKALLGIGVVLLGGGIIFFEVIAKSFFVTETIENFRQFSLLDQTQYIRAIMIYFGATLSLWFFPVGVGAGNFGSVMSLGSPAYGLLGISQTHFFDALTGIYDSNAAAVLGEYGFIGLIIYTILTKRVIRTACGDDRAKSVVIAAVIIILSLTQPFFAYHVNAVNVLLLIFSLSSNGASRGRERGNTRRLYRQGVRAAAGRLAEGNAP